MHVESNVITLAEGPKGGVCVRFTKIIDSHLRFTKIIRKYIGISWFSLRKHVIWSLIYDHVFGRIQDFLIGGNQII